MLRRLTERWLLPTDLWERHAAVARLAEATPTTTVLDVGGTEGTLFPHLGGAPVTTANVEPPCDVLVEPGTPLPVADRSYDLVVSLDTLEHLAPDERAPFVADLGRVARRRVLLCCPLGTPEHLEAEREIDRWYEQLAGSRHRWLAEHVEHGIPSPASMRALADDLEQRGFAAHLLFQGDFRRVNRQFQLAARARFSRRPSDVLDYARLRLRTAPDGETGPSAHPWTNRVFLIADRTPNRGSTASDSTPDHDVAPESA